jgi:hypothetical protein
MRQYTLYLNTKTSSGFLTPIDKTNLNSVRWNINWNSIFPTSMNAIRFLNNNAKCHIKAQLVSSSGTGITWANQKGTLRIGGLVSNSQNPLNGVFLGVVKPVVSPIVATDWYLECDTTQTLGVEINIPINNNILVGLYNDAGNPMTNALEYELILHFEIEDDDNETKYLTNANNI